MKEIDKTILDVPDSPTGATLTEEQIALHEAAHVVPAYRLGGGVDDGGIDLQHRSSDGAKGGGVYGFGRRART